MYDDISFDIGGKKKDKLLSRIAALEAERDRLLARIEDTDSACADYAFAGAHTAREIIEKLHDRIRGHKTDRDLLAEANDQLRAELEKLSRNDLPGMCEAFDRVIEAYHSKTHPFHNPVAADARVALRVLRGICSTITALREGGE